MTTVAQWLASAQGLDRLERDLLLGHVLNLSRAQLLTHNDQTIPAPALDELSRLSDALREGQPYAYVVGTQEFWSLEFQVNPHVLIPRPETELLVELCCKESQGRAHVLDLGTGSGAIAISIAHERPDLTVTATDFSAAALAVAQQNSKRHNANVRFLQSDWFKSLTGQWDIIVSNPPYIKAEDPHLKALTWEPQTALVSGDGYEAIRVITENAARHLNPGGKIMIEHGYDQHATVADLLKQHGFESVRAHQDLAGILRVTSGVLASTMQPESGESLGR